jgi:hypothetical protein
MTDLHVLQRFASNNKLVVPWLDPPNYVTATQMVLRTTADDAVSRAWGLGYCGEDVMGWINGKPHICVRLF